MNHSQRGFKLIEILLLIGILALIATLFATNAHFPSETPRIAAAQRGLQKIASAVENYHQDTGSFPQSIHMLTSKPDNVANWKGPYLQRSQIMDPWRTAYHYQSPGNNGQAFEVISFGSDGTAGETGHAQDLTNWE